MMKVIASRIAPSARASSKLPCRVSSTIAVVKTRVRPSMLPPTSMTAPTSEMMPPNPAMMETITPMRASANTVNVVCQLVAPSERTCWRSPASMPITAAIVKPATSGNAMMDWAMTIAPGVNSVGTTGEFRLPSGPLRDSSR